MTEIQIIISLVNISFISFFLSYPMISRDISMISWGFSIYVSNIFLQPTQLIFQTDTKNEFFVEIKTHLTTTS